MKLTWIGHSCFKLEEKGYTIIFDPYGDGTVPGLGPVREKADLVLCSHEHADHNAADKIEIVSGGVNPYVITKIDAYHDDQSGSLRGDNTIHLLDDGTFRIIHFGDIGCRLTDEQAEALKRADVVMIPVGGFYTVDAKEAKRILEQINPGIVIPMHFRKEEPQGFGFDVIDTVEPFLNLCENVVKMDASEIEPDKKKAGQTMVLMPQNLA